MLTLAHLARRFDGRGGVQDVSLTVPPAAIYVLCGANGAGKSTTLAVLAGLLFARTGTLSIDGTSVPLNRYASRPGLGFLPDTPIVDDALTGWEWASFVAGIKQVGWPGDAIEWAEQLGLSPDTIGRSVRTLSFGTRRKLALWVELMTTHRVLLLDEPLIGLDPEAIEGFHVVARRFVAQGRSIILSTHLLREAEALATHVGIIARGATRREGTLAEVCASSGSLQRTFLDLSAA